VDNLAVLQNLVNFVHHHVPNEVSIVPRLLTRLDHCRRMLDGPCGAQMRDPLARVAVLELVLAEIGQRIDQFLVFRDFGRRVAHIHYNLRDVALVIAMRGIHASFAVSDLALFQHLLDLRSHDLANVPDLLGIEPRFDHFVEIADRLRGAQMRDAFPRVASLQLTHAILDKCIDDLLVLRANCWSLLRFFGQLDPLVARHLFGRPIAIVVSFRLVALVGDPKLLLQFADGILFLAIARL